MNLLLDTQSFLWWATAPEKLSNAASAACHDPGNTLILSVVSVWEMQIKLQLGRLTLADPLDELVRREQQGNGLQILTVLLPHVYGLAALPMHHKDPFDRLLMTQALVENLTLVSSDALFARYPVNLIW